MYKAIKMSVPKELLKLKINTEDRCIDSMLLEYYRNAVEKKVARYYRTDRNIFPSEVGYKDSHGNILFCLKSRGIYTEKGFTMDFDKVIKYSDGSRG